MDALGHRNLDQSGQHYMVDKDFIEFIVKSADLKESDIVLEIGYGHGALTKELIKDANVIAVDIEKRELGISSDKLEFVHGNILELLERLKMDYDFHKIVANIPYNISEPLLKKLFKTDFELAVLTMGKNFADLLKKRDNRISIIANKLFRIRYLKKVPKKAFVPQPRTESMIIRLDKIKNEDLDSYGMIYRDLVFLDTKRIRNAMEKIIQNESTIKKMTKKGLAKLIKDNHMTNICTKRIYELSNKEFLVLDKFLRKII